MDARRSNTTDRPAETRLEQLAAKLGAEVRAQLETRRWIWRPVASPEFRKVLESLHEVVLEISRLLTARREAEPLDDATWGLLEELLNARVGNLKPDGAWCLLESLQLMALALGGSDPRYLRTLLATEAALEMRGPSWEDPWPYYGWGRVRWSEAFGDRTPSSMLEELESDSDRSAAAAEALERLRELFRMRIENGRKRRTRLALRNAFFIRALLLLGPLVASLLALTVWSGDTVTWRIGLLMAVSGAVGGTVSGTLKLRNLIRITEFRLLGAGLLVQPLIGAAAALFVVFVLLSGIVQLPGVDPSAPSWEGLAAYAFAAGFSEPFWLGVVRRVVGVDRGEAGSRAGDGGFANGDVWPSRTPSGRPKAEDA